ncbi:hypothetical protein PHJA_000132700 [Phtheirospermum japonicum]|uniref:Uncharacterized protein n=1 Tax=Phtheirospermum japonicum TaxID=374723 RepID=A0A830B5L6_9LAMI|nr:hypothetical protein PHJA_000132700 [Phtheirospermum japonicum]
MKFCFLSAILPIHGYYWWAAVSTAKLGLGICAIRRGHAGESTFMPFKAFFVGSLKFSPSMATAGGPLRVWPS